MNSILIKNVLLNGQISNIKIEENLFTAIGNHALDTTSDIIIDGTNKAILPPFYNTHTHASMTLLRGYADDLPLDVWLNEYIWPFEAKLKEDDIYLGSRLAIVEMIKSGTVFFNDMYWHQGQTLRAAQEMGIRAAIGITTIQKDAEGISNQVEEIEKMEWDNNLIQITMAPHAIYTAGEMNYRCCCEIAKEKGWMLHTHIAETKKEFDECIKEHGCTPVEWLERIGVLDCRVIAAHAIYLTDNDMRILKTHNVTISHNPTSNMKLASGSFLTKEVMESGCTITLGTDGCSSNNNLDMREEMKLAAMKAKAQYGTEFLPASKIFEIATINGAKAFNINAGEIKEGKLADAILIDMNNERMVPCYDLLSNFVYAADSECIDTVICNGRILMQNRHIDGEEEIIAAVKNRYGSK